MVMFTSIAAIIEDLRSKASEWYAWLWPSDMPPATDQQEQPAEPPQVTARPAVPVQPSTPAVPTLRQPRDAAKVKRPAPVVPSQSVQKTPGATFHKQDTVRRRPLVNPIAFSSRGRNLEHLVARTRGEVCRKFFAGQIVGYTGRFPFDPSDIEKLIRRLGGTPGFDGMWQADQLMIIGREGFDQTYLKHSVQAGLRHGFECHYLSQEALTGLMQFGTLPGYYRGDSRIHDHAGLRCVASFGFVWPSTDVAAPSGVVNTENGSAWPTSHEMVSVYRYRVDARTGLTLAERQERLRRAVAGLGLRCVAEHIAANIQLAKNRQHANMESPIEKWEDDLEWLHDTFYKNSIRAFVWPRVYRSRKKAS
jgi:hypothetical protein